VRPRDAREWIGPLFARGGDAAREAPRLDAEIAGALPGPPGPPSHALGDGVHGQIAARLTTLEGEHGLRRLRIDVRGTEQLDAALVVAAESTTVGEPSQPGARAVEGGHGRHVVVWSVPLAELARGPLELSYRRSSPTGQAPP